MTRYRVSKDASTDLDEAFVYWAERAGIEIASEILDNIIDRFSMLGQFPESGRPSSDFGAGVRIFPADKYLIYYRKVARGILISRVIHGARDQRKALRERGKPPR